MAYLNTGTSGDILTGTLTGDLLTADEIDAGLIPTTTALASSPNPVGLSGSVTFTATINPSSGGPPTGMVTFKHSTATIGTDSLDGAGIATCSYSSLPAGSQNITAVYGGDVNFGSSTSSILTQYVTAPVSGPVIVADYVLDHGLSVLADEADMILLCHTEPTTYLEAFSSFTLGIKDFLSPGNAFGSIGSGSPGRLVGSTPITDGSIISSGTVTYWATVDSDNSRLLARGPVVTPKDVTSGGQFSLPAFTITMPGQ